MGVAGLILAAVLFFVAWERNKANADTVAAMVAMGAHQVFGFDDLKPTMPAASKYALFFGVLSTVGGLVCLSKASKAPVD